MKLKSELILCLTCFISCCAMGKLITVNYDGSDDSGFKTLKGESIEINCSTTAIENGSKPSFNWSRGNETITSSDGFKISNNTEVLRIDRDLYGDLIGATIRCTLDTTDKNYKEIHLYTEPRITKRLSKSTILMQGDTLTIKCEVAGFPLPTFEWYKSDEEDEEGTLIEPNTEDLRIKIEADEKNVSGAKLEIEKIDYSDKSVYKCKASNDAGQVTLSTRVRVKDRMAALWPFLGICAEVIVLCTIIFIFERKRSKKEAEEDALDHDTKDSTDHKGDVRQRK